MRPSERVNRAAVAAGRVSSAITSTMPTTVDNSTTVRAVKQSSSK